MGRLANLDMMEQTNMEVSLKWHLTANHYPPLPSSMIPTCKAAIEAVLEEDSRRAIKLPEGMQYAPEGKEPSDTAPAGQIIEFAHLHDYVSHMEYYIDD